MLCHSSRSSGFHRSASSAKRADIDRIDAAIAERLDERQAVATRILGKEVGVGGDERAEEIAEGHVDRRQVVDGADAHVEHALREPHRFLGEPLREIGMDLALRQLARAAGGDPAQVRHAGRIHLDECVEHRRDEDRAPLVRLEGLTEDRRVGSHALAVLESAEPVAERVAIARCACELRGQFRQQAVGCEIAARALDLIEQKSRHREVLEDGDDVGEGLVEGDHVDVGGLEHAAVHAVEDRVRHLVGDDVVRQAAEDDAARQLVARIGRRRVEVAEQQRGFRWGVVGVLLAQRVRVDAQPLHVAVAPAS